jgi:exopolyphosphatase/guanosine-5'-triphosphate,3'-diphosphate pyrophosphatase
MRRANHDTVLAAIDVGSNSVKLELARPLPDGSFETIHQERDPVRPGERVFTTGIIPPDVADRLLSALRRYGALCRRFGARVRAVATSALREARNKEDILRRARMEAGLNLEIVSGREEARLICLGVLHGKPAKVRSLCIDVGGGSTEVASATGEQPINLWSIALGAVRLTELFGSNGRMPFKQLNAMREYANEAIGERLPRRLDGLPRRALGSSGTIRALVSYAAEEGSPHASAKHLTRAVEELVEMSPSERRTHFEPGRADIIVAGAVILESLARHLNLESVTAVDRGLRDGLLVELMRRRSDSRSDRWLLEATATLGRRFQADEHHARQVAKISLAMFDALGDIHRLPSDSRPLLEVAALLHDIGNAVNYDRHHRHTYYLITHADIPGLVEREREIVARIARYHRRSFPDPRHSGMKGLSRSEVNVVRKLSTLLRVADSLDRSHHQPVQQIRASADHDSVVVHLRAKAPVDLELWDVEHEAANFKRVFRRKLAFRVERH